MAKVTIQSMASQLGLSRNTVSMALKGNSLVTQQTRELVLDYARKVGYAGILYGETSAESALEKEAYSVMILRKPDVAVYWDKVINGISEEASKNHCKTQVAVVTDEAEQTLRLPIGLDEKISAVFAVKLINRAYLQKIKEMGIPVFTLDDYKHADTEPLGDVVKTESVNAVTVLTRHLISQGMTKIAFINENSNHFETMYDRMAGYLYAMQEAGLSVDPVYVQENIENGYEVGVLEQVVGNFPEIPEAIVCGNDELAKRVTMALRIRGYQVPQDVAVTGYDNDEEGMLDPFFTTVDVNAKWLGRRMVQCFLWRMENPDAPYEKVCVTGRVIFRKSSQKK